MWGLMPFPLAYTTNCAIVQAVTTFDVTGPNGNDNFTNSRFYKIVIFLPNCMHKYLLAQLSMYLKKKGEVE